MLIVFCVERSSEEDSEVLPTSVVRIHISAPYVMMERTRLL